MASFVAAVVLTGGISSARSAEPCGDWVLTATPDVGNSVTRLTDVAANTTDDAWAVGYWRDDPAGSGPLVLRWDGESWSPTDLPETGHLGTLPETVAVETSADGSVWVVGNVTTTYPANNLPWFFAGAAAPGRVQKR